MAERDLNRMNDGRLRHPLFGRRGHWYPQAVTPGWWDKAMAKGEEGVRRELTKAIDEVARSLGR